MAHLTAKPTKSRWDCSSAGGIFSLFPLPIENMTQLFTMFVISGLPAKNCNLDIVRQRFHDLGFDLQAKSSKRRRLNLARSPKTPDARWHLVSAGRGLFMTDVSTYPFGSAM